MKINFGMGIIVALCILSSTTAIIIPFCKNPTPKATAIEVAVMATEATAIETAITTTISTTETTIATTVSITTAEATETTVETTEAIEDEGKEEPPITIPETAPQPEPTPEPIPDIILETPEEIYREPEQEEEPPIIYNNTEEIIYYYTEDDVYEIAKVISIEAYDIPNEDQLDAVAWCICNRLDTKYKSWYQNLYDVYSDGAQFAYYPNRTPDERYIRSAKRVLEDWNNEKNNLGSAHRVIPQNYNYFSGWGGNNHFYWNYNNPCNEMITP